MPGTGEGAGMHHPGSLLLQQSPDRSSQAQLLQHPRIVHKRGGQLAHFTSQVLSDLSRLSWSSFGWQSSSMTIWTGQ